MNLKNVYKLFYGYKNYFFDNFDLRNYQLIYVPPKKEILNICYYLKHKYPFRMIKEIFISNLINDPKINFYYFKEDNKKVWGKIYIEWNNRLIHLEEYFLKDLKFLKKNFIDYKSIPVLISCMKTKKINIETIIILNKIFDIFSEKNSYIEVFQKEINFIKKYEKYVIIKNNELENFKKIYMEVFYE